MSTTPIATEYVEPTLFELQGPHTHITFATSDISGVPSLTYRHRAEVRTFRGSDIRFLNSEIGVLITVTLEAVPDLKTVTLTVLIPAVNVAASRAATIETHAFRTTARTSIAGPRLLDGQLHVYEAMKLSGRAVAAAS
jgi:hypothetical protein